MYRIDYYLTRDDYEDRKLDSTFDPSSWGKAMEICKLLLDRNPHGVVCIGVFG